MATRSTTARRLAIVVVATAAVSLTGAGSSCAASSPAPAASVPAAQAQTGLLGGLVGTLNGLLGTDLLQLEEQGVATPADQDKALLGPVVGGLTKTLKDLPVVGKTVGGVTDTTGLSQAKQETPAAPALPTKPQPTTPDKGKTDKSIGRSERTSQMPPAGSTWTAPMTVNLPQTPAVVANESSGFGKAVDDFVGDVVSIFPTNAAEAAAAGAGAATIALIVLGGIACTGAAGAASVAGRRGLISGSVGGSL